MNTPWIHAQGTATISVQENTPDATLSTVLHTHTPADATYYMAQGVASFCAGRVAVDESGAPCFTPALPEAETMLELRVFGKNAELWLHRTTLDAPFAWRVADDAVLTRNVATAQTAFLQDPNHYRLTQMQYCSIDHNRTTAPPQQDEHGRQLLHAIGGRQYALPAPDGCDCVAVVQYLSYHPKTAQAIPMDYRFAGFGKKNDTPKAL